MKSFLSVFCLLALFFPKTASAQNLQLLARLPYDTASLAGCWHHVDSFGNEYALVGTSKGLSIVDLSRPEQPYQKFQVPGPTNNWREVKTWAGFAYVGSEALGSGITIVDLRGLPDSIHWKVWKGDGLYENQILSSHALAAEAGYLYIYGGSMLARGAVICDLEDPWNPKIVGQYNDNYLHDGFVRGDTLWGSEIYEGQFSVIDISDRSHPVLLQTQETPGKFNHNGWLSDDGRTFFTTDERSDTPLAAFDVSDLDNIALLDTYKPSLIPAREVHNTRGLGHFLVNPSYGGQLTIVDAAQPDNLIETAIASLGTSLVWDADPYLPSGILFATAKNEGLFIFRPVWTPAARLEGAVTNVMTGDSLSKATITVLGTPQTEFSRQNGIYKTGAAEAGTYTVRVTKAGFAPETIPNVVLHSGQTTRLDVPLNPLVNAKSVENEAIVRVAPTLVNQCLTVEILGAGRFSQAGTKIRVSDLNGKTMLRAEVSGTRTEVCFEQGLPAGQYVVVLENEAVRSVPVRFVKS